MQFINVFKKYLKLTIIQYIYLVIILIYMGIYLQNLIKLIDTIIKFGSIIHLIALLILNVILLLSGIFFIYIIPEKNSIGYKWSINSFSAFSICKFSSDYVATLIKYRFAEEPSIINLTLFHLVYGLGMTIILICIYKESRKNKEFYGISKKVDYIVNYTKIFYKIGSIIAAFISLWNISTMMMVGFKVDLMIGSLIWVILTYIFIKESRD